MYTDLYSHIDPPTIYFSDTFQYDTLKELISRPDACQDYGTAL